MHKEAVEKYNKGLYEKYTEAELLNLEQVGEKLGKDLKEKFEKIKQFKDQ